MDRHIKAKANGTYLEIVPTGSLRLLDFARLQLKKGEKHAGETGEREYVFDIFSGAASVFVESLLGRKQVFPHAGARPDVFSGPPVMIYLPRHSSFEMTVLSESLDAGVFSAPAATLTHPRLMEGKDIIGREVGLGNWQRTVYTALGEDIPAERLLAGETLNPPGNWSSYPPHKHDRHNPPHEAALEEIYFFRVKPSQGYGLIWTYTEPGDPEGFSNVFVVEDGDTVLLPKGYHPVVAAPGYQLHYTWVLAGEERRFGAWKDDPRHAWVKKR